jgi:hypothetical protein
VLLGGSTVAVAQWGWRRMPPRYPSAEPTHRLFTFARGLYQSTHRERGGQGWHTDYPDADINFSIRLSELTHAPVGVDRRNEPDHVVVRLTDARLFDYPFLFMSDVGTIWLDAEEVERLGAYLRKGGFLWVDDFWGSWEWAQWVSQIDKVLPASQYPIVDLPLDHALFSTLYNIWEVPQIANIGFWRRSGGRTSERGRDSAEPHFRVIFDEHGRIMVAMTHNTDIQDAWEREADDPRYFDTFAPDGYSLGVNVLLYAMSH